MGNGTTKTLSTSPDEHGLVHRVVISDRVLARGERKYVSPGRLVGSWRDGDRVVVKILDKSVPDERYWLDEINKCDKLRELIIAYRKTVKMPIKLHVEYPMTAYVDKVSKRMKKKMGLNVGEFVLVEEILGNTYNVFMTSFGIVDPKLPETVSTMLSELMHFSYHESCRKEVFCGFQGTFINGLLSLAEPTVHTMDNTYEDTDQGVEGILVAFEHHYCTDRCRYWLQPEGMMMPKVVPSGIPIGFKDDILSKDVPIGFNDDMMSYEKSKDIPIGFKDDIIFNETFKSIPIGFNQEVTSSKPLKGPQIGFKDEIISNDASEVNTIGFNDDIISHKLSEVNNIGFKNGVISNEVSEVDPIGFQDNECDVHKDIPAEFKGGISSEKSKVHVTKNFNPAPIAVAIEVTDIILKVKSKEKLNGVSKVYPNGIKRIPNGIHRDISKETDYDTVDRSSKSTPNNLIKSNSNGLSKVIVNGLIHPTEKTNEKPNGLNKDIPVNGRIHPTEKTNEKPNGLNKDIPNGITKHGVIKLHSNGISKDIPNEISKKNIHGIPKKNIPNGVSKSVPNGIHKLNGISNGHVNGINKGLQNNKPSGYPKTHGLQNMSYNYTPPKRIPNGMSTRGISTIENRKLVSNVIIRKSIITTV